MFLARSSLRMRMLISICVVALIAFAVTITFITYQARTIVRDDAMNLANGMAETYSERVATEMNAALDTARTLARTLEGMKGSGSIPDRKLIDGILRTILEANPRFMGIWTCWEPDALDSWDTTYAGRPGHDATGRYIPYWNRGSGEIHVEPLVGYDQPGTGDYYLIPLKTGKEAILEPYVYSVGGRDILMTTLSVPIRRNDMVIAVAGVDIALDTFKTLIDSVKLYETGYGFMLSNQGTFVAHPKSDLVGHNLADNKAPAEIVAAVKAGEYATEIQKGPQYGRGNPGQLSSHNGWGNRNGPGRSRSPFHWPKPWPEPPKSPTRPSVSVSFPYWSS